MRTVLFVAALVAADAGATTDDLESAALARCVTERNALKYSEGRPGREAIADRYREMLAACLSRARRQVENERQQQHLVEQMRADAERRRESAQAAAEERARLERENAERRRIMAEAEEHDRERQEQDPAFQREKWSERLCDGVWRRQCALASIAAEKKLAKRVGVLNLRLLQDEKETLKDAEDDIRDALRELKSRRLKPLQCKPAECDD